MLWPSTPRTRTGPEGHAVNAASRRARHQDSVSAAPTCRTASIRTRRDPVAVDLVDAYLAELRGLSMLSPTEEVALARRIEASEREVVSRLLRTSVVGAELRSIQRKLDRGAVRLSSVVLGPVLGDERARRAERTTWDRVMREFFALDAQCAERRRESLRGRRLSRARVLGLRDAIEYLERRMIAVLGEVRFTAEVVARMLGRLRRLVLGAESLRVAPKLAVLQAIRAIEEQSGLSVEELLRTWKRVQAAVRAASSAKHALVRANLRLVVAMAKRHRGRGTDFLDLIQEGNLGLMRAAERFDYRYDCRFSSYAGRWIRPTVVRAADQQGRTIRLPPRAARSVRRAGAQPPGADGHAMGGLSRATSDELGTLAFNGITLSLESPIRDGSSTLEHCLADDAPDANDVLARLEIHRRVLSLLDRLDPREAYVLRARFGFGDEGSRTLARIGRELGVCRERVRQIEASALAALRSPAQEEGLADCLE
jgi:RNA polymerase primary sigma factor